MFGTYAERLERFVEFAADDAIVSRANDLFTNAEKSNFKIHHADVLVLETKKSNLSYET